MKISIEVPYAILFVCDPENKSIDVPRYVDSSVVASSPSCVSISTQAEVDGSVDVSLDLVKNMSETTGYSIVFHGTILTPCRKVGVITANNHSILELRVETPQVEIFILVDNMESPGSVKIGVLLSPL